MISMLRTGKPAGKPADWDRQGAEQPNPTIRLQLSSPGQCVRLGWWIQLSSLHSKEVGLDSFIFRVRTSCLTYLYWTIWKLVYVDMT